MELYKVLLAQGIPLSRAFDSISDGIVIVTPELKTLFWNRAAQEVAGVTPGKDSSEWERTIGTFYPDQETPHPIEKLPLFRAVAGETVEDYVLFLRNEKKGTSCFISCNASPIKDGEKIVAAILTFRDVTANIKREAEIARERAFYHQILDVIPAFIFSKDLDGEYTFLNSKFHDIFESAFGSRFNRDFIDAQDLREARTRDLQAIQEKRALEFEEEYKVHGTDRKVCLRTVRVPMFDGEGKVFGISGIAFDVTAENERKKALEEIRAQFAQASKLAALGIMAAEIGHEINNPLSIIRTSTWLLRKTFVDGTVDTDAAVAKLDEIEATVERIHEIVRSLRNISRDSTAEKLESSRVREILKDIRSISWPRMQPRGIALLVDDENPLMDLDVPCMRVQLSEVFINVLANAVDAVENTKDPWIRIELHRDGDALVFRVCDSGPGIPPELDQKIFATFFSTKVLGKGTGLGLSISRDIMLRHGGNLTLNRKISGNCFEISLPLRKS